MKLSKPIKAIFKNEVFLLNIYLVIVTILMFFMIFIIDIKDLYNIIFFYDYSYRNARHFFR